MNIKEGIMDIIDGLRHIRLNFGRDNLDKLGRMLLPKILARRMHPYMRTAGFDEFPYGFLGFAFYLAFFAGLFIFTWPPLGTYYNISDYGGNFAIPLAIFLFFGFVFAVTTIFAGLMRVYFDFVIYNRKKNVEEFLPDLLQQASANIRAGMTIDKALWFAVRPNFGILAHEIEIVARKTLGGVDFTQALEEFTERYDSSTLKRSISLLINGLEAGGETGELLNKIAVNIQENKIMQKELAANLKTYAIFISFASIVAAPVLFALSYQLLQVVQTITSSITLPKGQGGFGLMLDLSGQSIKISDFRFFAVLSMIITSFFSAAIVGTIQKGNIKDSIRYIPIFTAVSIILFYVVSIAMSSMLGDLF
ncbi:type II secretion system F family protein [Candidatus Woesearchaeota archaeon]|nr:type II secretion system F family protein [Candidatus Woesearchaeota archaeon]